MASIGGPAVYTGCTNSLGLGGTTVTPAGTWTATAVTTSSVTIDARASSGPVAVIALGSGCRINVPSPVRIAGNSWVNGRPSFLTLNSSASFAISSSGCFGLIGTTARLSAAYDVGATIT
jgi:hypothetical protein